MRRFITDCPRHWTVIALLLATASCHAQAPAAGAGADHSPVAPQAEAKAPAITRIATWNIEHFNALFDQVRQPPRTRNRTELWRDEEDKLELQLVFDLEVFDPDIIVIQESCDQEMLEYFNKQWLGGRYDYIKVFKSNTPGQWVSIMAKPGYRMLEVREYADEVDPVDDEDLRNTKARSYGEGNPLFPRGPGFVKFQTPAGAKLWVGSTHVKSKGGNSYAVTRWRARQVERLRDICLELARDTPLVYLGGDFNDSFGRDRLEQRLELDAIAVMLQASDDRRMVSPTHELELRDKDLVTYHSKLKPFDPVFVDHVFVTPELRKRIEHTRVITQPIAYPASDHLPVVINADLNAN